MTFVRDNFQGSFRGYTGCFLALIEFLELSSLGRGVVEDALPSKDVLMVHR